MNEIKLDAPVSQIYVHFILLFFVQNKLDKLVHLVCFTTETFIAVASATITRVGDNNTDKNITTDIIA